MESEFLIVARKVLEEEKRAMSPWEIVDLATKRGFFSDKRAGKTPDQTMKSKLSVHVRRKGETSIFVRTERGKFFLRHLLADGQLIYEARPYHRVNPAERVLVFKNGQLDKYGKFQGVKKEWRKFFRRIINGKGTTYLDRLAAESDVQHKQVVTYILVTKGGQVLAYKRGNYSRVADFLKGSHCIGFGGHVIYSDFGLFSADDMGIKGSAVRELLEELKLPNIDKGRIERGVGLTIRGILNDDSSELGEKHFGVVFQYEIARGTDWPKPETGEKAITQLRWLGLDRKPVRIWEFEYWSQLCLREFFPELVHTAPEFRIIRKVPLRPPHLLCVLGMVGSGKSEATKILREELGYYEVNSGRVLSELLGIPGVPTTRREKFQKEAWKFICRKNGPRKLAKLIWQKVEESKQSRILIDGIRQRETLRWLHYYSENRRIGLLYVHTLPDLAFKFYTERERSGVSVAQFLRMRNAEVELEVEEMIEKSDAIVYNWTGRMEYRGVIKALMKEVLGPEL